MSDVIAKALERLESGWCGIRREDSSYDHSVGTLLRDLIAKSTEEDSSGHWCLYCHSELEGHAPDCALIALCRAIVGEGA